MDHLAAEKHEHPVRAGATVAGKPSTSVLKPAVASAGGAFPPDRVGVVGDDVTTDVRTSHEARSGRCRSAPARTRSSGPDGHRARRCDTRAPAGARLRGFGVHVDKADQLEGALRDALAHPGPALVDVAVNPDEPPLPSKFSYDQAKKFAAASMRDQPSKASIATTLNKIQQL
jgi:hypothetical protein